MSEAQGGDDPMATLPEPDALSDALAGVLAVLNEAVLVAAEGGSVDLAGFDQTMDRLCRDAHAAAQHDPARRPELADALSHIAAALDRLAAALNKPAEPAGSAGLRARALAAYGRPPAEDGH